MTHPMRGQSRLRGYLAAALLLALAGASHAEEARLGDVRKLQVITISLKVGSTEKESKQVVYTPPPGWYVRGHSVHCAEKTGNSSFTVNTMPRRWNWSSEGSINESYKLLIDAAAQAQDAGLKGKLAVEREQMLRELRKIRASHHALVVEATARGEGFLRSGGALELSVTAELVYVGTDEALKKAARQRAGVE